MGGSQAAAVLVGGFTAVFFLLALLFWILLIVARWKIFSKAGEAGWKSIIPIYSDYVQWRIGWQKTGFFWLYIILLFAGYFMMSMAGMTSAQMVGTQAVNASAIGNPMLAGAGAIAVLAGAIIALVAAYKLFQSFGKGVGMFIAYIFFPNIVLLVLGFGSAQYQGPRE